MKKPILLTHHVIVVNL